MIHIVLSIVALASAMPDACPPPPRASQWVITIGSGEGVTEVFRNDAILAILNREGAPISIDEAIDRVLRAGTPSTDEPGLDLDPHLTDHVRGAVTPSPAPEGGSIQ